MLRGLVPGMIREMIWGGVRGGFMFVNSCTPMEWIHVIMWQLVQNIYKMK